MGIMRVTCRLGPEESLAEPIAAVVTVRKSAGAEAAGRRPVRAQPSNVLKVVEGALLALLLPILFVAVEATCNERDIVTS
mmetsp:Transcript_1454/g.3318  ORF Transcript_1454/g.3318 Transcript_1454/m.3318 type:complete len:80 (+) Transcript_1454:701-940(+)